MKDIHELCRRLATATGLSFILADGVSSEHVWAEAEIRSPNGFPLLRIEFMNDLDDDRGWVVHRVEKVYSEEIRRLCELLEGRAP